MNETNIQHFHSIKIKIWYNVTMFKRYMKPDRIITGFDELLIESLPSGCSVAFVDLDNTLIHKATHHVNEQGTAWIKEFMATTQGHVILISNNKHSDFEVLANELNVPLIQYALKPVSLHYKRILKAHGWDKSMVMVIGDQLLTDILGGKLHGFYTIYHKPLSAKDVLYNGVIRKIEKKWISDYESKL